MEQSLSGFMREDFLKKEVVTYIASKKFKDEQGEPISWEIQVLSNKEVQKIIDRNTKLSPMNGAVKQYKKELNSERVYLEMALKAIIYPNLNDEQLQRFYGTIGAEDTLKAMLNPGELTDLMLAVQEACGYNVGMKEEIKHVKNC
ncbi:phage tail assembly chaperone [uncultured Megasphaera sp.]|uniref:phage tail assembly chaperone n=1 Tax=uncultured Megasphaera sp. TaxID=165188 RepID=UPI002058549A|nr:hypothetical protein [uncultured Megasphaera sp.]DAK32643.1 MAG TPA: tail assembly chaperone protein [Caudoviricetes sp.]